MITYNYYRQMAFYTLAVMWYATNELKLNLEEYDLEIYIIAIGKEPIEVRVFRVDEDVELVEAGTQIRDTLHKIKQHYDTGNWDHADSYYENNGIERL
jgi:hypothetical protein